jgi:hypothetical protein
MSQSNIKDDSKTIGLTGSIRNNDNIRYNVEEWSRRDPKVRLSKVAKPNDFCIRPIPPTGAGLLSSSFYYIGLLMGPHAARRACIYTGPINEETAFIRGPINATAQHVHQRCHRALLHQLFSPPSNDTVSLEGNMSINDDATAHYSTRSSLHQPTKPYHTRATCP